MATLVKALRFASANTRTLCAYGNRPLTYSLWHGDVQRSFSSEVQASPSNTEYSPSDVKLTDTCVSQLNKIAKEGSFLRVLVEGGGCSGFQYKFELDDNMGDEDRVFERDGAKIVVDEDSLEFMKGCTIDYHTELIRQSFVVTQNPKAEQGCSCGASFNIKL